MVFIFVCVATSAFCVSAKDTVDHSLWRLGFGYSSGGTGLLGDKKYDYDYDVDIYRVNIYRRLFDKTNWKGTVLISPQYNRTYFFNETESDFIDGYEYGVNLGFIMHYKLSNFLPYVLISLGPHFISGAPDRQVSGFIFSDNGQLGLEYRLTNDVYVDLFFGFRHLSNASLKQPNDGINSFLFGAGLSFDIGK